jgi:anti-anti-sigma factor
MSTKLSSVTAFAQLHVAMSCPSPTTASVAVVGEVDLATAPMLRERLLKVLHDRSPDQLDVDLVGVTFLDCAGIGALVDVRNAAVHAGCQMQVSHQQPIVRLVLEVTGLLGVLTAPITQPLSLPTKPEHPPGTGPTPATRTESRSVVSA